ncbi:MAG: hypothetical protein E7672_04615 [Ruminococcaceae bacterium]|nr:hypothetical protein [Oscillospiraceae bacterium]
MNSKKIIPYIELSVIITVLALTLIFGEETSEAVRESLTISAERIIPSLFPYMVLASVTVSSDILKPIYSKIPTEKLFSLPRHTASVLLTGFLCGFPVGASCACKLNEEQKLSAEDTAKLCAISASVSPSFLIGCVGSLWNSKKFGIFLYGVGILLNIIAGILMKNNKAKCSVTIPPISFDKTKSFTAILCRSISDAAVSCLSVTAFITFFRCAASLISCIIPPLSTIVTCVFEFSSGVILSSSLGCIVGAALCGFSVGFTGLSVMMQTYSLTGPRRVTLKYSIILSLIRGIVLAAASALFYRFSGMTSDCDAMAISDSFSELKVTLIIVSLFFAIIASNICSRRNYFKRKY